MEKLIGYINNIHPLGREDVDLLLASAVKMHVPKGTVLINEGKTDRTVYFITDGLFRASGNQGSREVTLWFAVPGEAVFSSWGYVAARPCQVSITAASDATIYRFLHEDIERLFESSPALSAWGRKLFARLLMGSDQSLLDLSGATAMERYTSLVEKWPDILQRVPLKDIAAYLWITPQSLSRIRGAYARRKK